MRPGRVAALVLVVLGLLGAVALFAWARSLGVPSYACAVLACGPLMCPALPAALLLWAGRGGRDPLDVSHLYEGDGRAARRRRHRVGLD